MAQNDEEYIGDSSKVLCLRNSGQIKLLYGNRYINLFDSEGNLNAKIKDLIHVGPKPTNSSLDGFYFTPGSGNILPKFYIKQGNQILEVSNESSKTNLPEGSIIMYKGSLAPESEGWYKFNAPTNVSGTIYIINKQGPEYQNPDLYDIWLDWLDTNDNRVITTTVKMGDNSFSWPQLKNLVNSLIPLLYEYSSSDIGVATINSSGVITLVSPGWTVIKAETQADGIHKYDYASYTLNVISADKTTVIVSTSNLSVASNLGSYTPVINVTGANLNEVTLSVVFDPNNVVSSISGQTIMLSENAGNASIRASVGETDTHKSGSVTFTLSVTAVQENISLSWSGTNGGTITLNLGDSITLPSLTISGTSVDQSLFKRDYITYTKNGDNIATISKDSNGNIVINLRPENFGEAQICAQCTATNEHSAASACFTLKVNEVLLLSSFLTYKVGLISDIHYHVMGNPNIIVDGNDTSTTQTDDDYKKANSLFREDLEKIISEFEKYDVDFVASTGDITDSDINDFIEFTKDYKAKWSSNNNRFITDSTKTYTSLTNTIDSTKSVNLSKRDFYCTLGNHDCQITYKNTEYCKYYRYGYPKTGGTPTSGIVTDDHDGRRWIGIKPSNNNVINKKRWDNNLNKWIDNGYLKGGTFGSDPSYDYSIERSIVNNKNEINFDCPGSLAGSDKIMFSDTNSLSYYITRNNGNDIFIFLSTYFGKGRYETFVDTASSANRDAVYSERVNAADMSLIHGYNRLSSSDINRLKAKMSQDYSFPGNEEHFNFLYFLTDDLLQLEELLRTNAQKRCFVFEHFFLPHKAGGGNSYQPGTSSILSGITFHFLNYLNNKYPKTIWFSGHSHISWLEDDMLKGVHWTNKNYPYVAPTSSDNTSISADGADSTNDYFGDYGKLSIPNGHYDSNHNMWKVTSGGTPYLRAPGLPTGTSAWNVHLPSMSRPVSSTGAFDISGCEAAIMEVHEDYVEIKKIGYHTSDGSTYIADGINDPTLTIDTTTGNGTCNDTAPELTESSGLAVRVFLVMNIINKATLNNQYVDISDINSRIEFELTDHTKICCYRTSSIEGELGNKYGKIDEIRNNPSASNYADYDYFAKNQSYKIDRLIYFINSIPTTLRYIGIPDRNGLSCSNTENKIPECDTGVCVEYPTNSIRCLSNSEVDDMLNYNSILNSKIGQSIIPDSFKIYYFVRDNNVEPTMGTIKFSSEPDAVEYPKKIFTYKEEERYYKATLTGVYDCDKEGAVENGATSKGNILLKGADYYNRIRYDITINSPTSYSD